MNPANAKPMVDLVPGDIFFLRNWQTSPSKRVKYTTIGIVKRTETFLNSKGEVEEVEVPYVRARFTKFSVKATDEFDCNHVEKKRTTYFRAFSDDGCNIYVILANEPDR